MTNKVEFKRKFIKPSNETAEKIIFGLYPDDAKPFNADIDSVDSSLEIIYGSPLACEVGVWLFNNQHLPPLERVEKIKEMLMSLSKDELFAYAVEASATLDATVRLADQAMAAAGNIFSTADAVHSHARGLIAKKAADAKYNQPNGSRERAKKICEMWATGTYTSRDICAEQEYDGLGYGSFKAARNALKNTPNPTKK
jgi:hypothetical protein